MHQEVVFSLAHSILCIPLALHGLWESGWLGHFFSSLPSSSSFSTFGVEEFWWKTTPATTRCIMFSSLYFLWDLVHEFMKKDGKAENRFHAFMGFTSYGVIGLWLAQGHILLCLSLLNELSTPFYNAYRITKGNKIHSRRNKWADPSKVAGLQKTFMVDNPLPERLGFRKIPHALAKKDADVETVDVAAAAAAAGRRFAMAFFLIRVLFMPAYLLFRIRPFIVAGLLNPRCYLPALAATLELAVSTALNFYWFALILRHALKKSELQQQKITQFTK